MIIKSTDLESSGKDILTLQNMLKERGYRIREITGEFDSATKSALRAFQNDNNLETTGILDDTTWSFVSKCLNLENKNQSKAADMHESEIAENIEDRTGNKAKEIIEFDISKREKEKKDTTEKARTDNESIQRAQRGRELENTENTESPKEMECDKNTERTREMEHKERLESARAETDARNRMQRTREREIEKSRAQFEHNVNAERAREMECKKATERTDPEHTESAYRTKVTTERAEKRETRQGKAMPAKNRINNRSMVIDPAAPWEHTLISPAKRSMAANPTPEKKECVVPETILPPTFSPLPQCRNEISVASYEEAEAVAKMQDIFENALTAADIPNNFGDAEILSDMQDTFADAEPVADMQDIYVDTEPVADTQNTYVDTVPVANSQDTYADAKPVADSQDTYADAEPVADSQDTYADAEHVADSQDTYTDAEPVADSQDTYADAEPVVDSQDTYANAEPVVDSQDTYAGTEPVADMQEAKIQGAGESNRLVRQEESRPLQWGSRNRSVHILQHRLTSLGYFSGIINGQFGFETRRAVMDFQRDRGLMPMGVVDAATWEALQDEQPNNKTS